MEDSKERIDSITAEAKVFELLSQSLTDGEKIQYNTQTDLYFPKGLQKMNWPPKTHVEIRYRLVD